MELGARWAPKSEIWEAGYAATVEADGAVHAANLSHPDIVNEAIADFLAAL